MKLQVGKAYLDREGNTVVIERFTGGMRTWPYEGSNGLSFTSEGRWATDTCDDPNDLVEEARTKTVSEVLAAVSLDKDGPEYDGPLEDPKATDDVLEEVFAERERQERKWGVQNHEPWNWLPILGEEFGEVCRALCEAGVAEKLDDLPTLAKHTANYREELVQTAAVCVAMIECLDRNK